MSELNSNDLYHLTQDKDRTTVTDWLNTAAISQHPTERIELLLKAQEFLIYKATHLLPELLNDILSFSTDRSGDVKKVVIGFIEEVCKKNEELIPVIVVSLHLLLCDESVQVQKRVIQASSSIYRNMIMWLCRAPVITKDMEQAWNNLNQMKIEIINMIDNDNDGIRTHSIKFLEAIVLLQTYPEHGVSRKENDFCLEDVPLTLKIARRRKLEEEANHIFSLLIKFHGSPHISSVNLMACMGSLCTVAKLRPEFMTRVINALENLSSNFPPTLSDSQVSSVRKHLKLQLLNLLKHPSSYDHRFSIMTMLTDLGCSSQELAKFTPRTDERKRLPKRNLEPVNSSSAKKPRLIQELEMKMEETIENNQRQHANEVNQQFINEHLNVHVATQIVFATMKNVPNAMTPIFVQDYAKAFSGAPICVKDIAKLLAEQFTDAEVGPGAKLVPELKVTIKQEPDLVTSKEDLAELKEKLNKEVKASRIFRPRIKTLKLAEITRPLSSDSREHLLINAVHRVLQSEKSSAKAGVSHIRYKIITTLASTFGAAVRETVLMYLLGDLRLHMDLALAWLYEEYSLMQGFNRMPTVLKREGKPDRSYNTLLCALISSLQGGDVRDRDGLLARLFLEAPLLTDEAMDLLKHMCRRPDRCVTALNLMHDLVVRRPPRGALYLSALLVFSTFEEVIVREEAVARIISLYERPEWQTSIETYAMKYLEMLKLAKPPDLLFGEVTGRPIKMELWTDELNRVCLTLYLALLPYNESLIHELSRIYTQTSADIKRTILRLLEQPIRGMGMDSPELLTLVEKCPKGSETLVTRIIHILSDRGPPSPLLVARVRDLYQSRVSDVRFLIPVLNGLTKKEVTAALPKLIKLNPVVVKEVFNRLLGLHGDSPISPSELLIALHLIDPSKAEIKAIMKATSLCFAEKQVYTQEVLAVVVQQLMEINPLPTLLMRTVIQSLSLYPRLTGFVMNILQRLILKQVWRQKVIWEGFIKCCQRTKPQSFQVLLQLPQPQLVEALSVCPDMKQPLLEHVLAFSEAQRAHVPASTMEMLQGSETADKPVEMMDTEEQSEQTELDTLDEPLPPGLD